MPAYRVLRGVCVGPERHLAPGQEAQIVDEHLAQYLVSIGAVERMPDPPAPEEPAADPHHAAAPATKKTAGKKE